MSSERLPDGPALIQSAIDRDAISDLHDALEGLFNFRRSLFAEQTQSSLEIYSTERAIGEICFYLADWNGIETVAARLWRRGIVETRGEVLRLASYIYDEKDREHTGPSVTVPVIGIVGGIATGKGTVGDMIKDVYGSFHLPLSDRLREFAVAEGNFYPQTREGLRDVNDQLKPRFGKHVFVEWTWIMAQRMATQYKFPLLTFDGFRSVEESQWFQEKGGLLIGVRTDKEIRYQRLLVRNRDADDFSREKFEQSDEIERKWIDPIYGICDQTVENNGTLEDLQAQVNTVLKVLHISDMVSRK